MSYFRRALSGVQSQPPGGRVSKAALGDIPEWGTTVGQTVPPPSRVMAARGRVGPRWYRQLQGTTLGADEPTGNTLAVPTLPEPKGDVDVIRHIDENLAKISAAQDEDAKRRRIGNVLAGVGLAFAAIKLGIIAIPALRRRSSDE